MKMRRGKVEGLKEGFNWKIHKLANLIKQDENVPPSITRETYLPGNSVHHSYTGARLTGAGATYDIMDYEDAHNGRGPSGAPSSNPAMSIIGAEDEDFENDEQPIVDDQCSHFNSIDLLKSRPTHLLVFVHHVMLQFDTAPVLCYLHADLFKNFNAKDTKKHFGEFYNTFLEKGAVLKVPVPNHIASELDRMRPELISEEQQKRYADEIQIMQSPEILRQLDDFRQKRMMGMTPNERELNDVESHRPTDRIPMEMKEKAVAESMLEKMVEANPSIVADKDKSNCIFGAVAFYMKHLGVKTRALDNKKTKSGWRPSVPSVLKPWGTNKLNKPDKKLLLHDGKQTRLDFEVKQNKPIVPPHRVSISDSGTTSGRKLGVVGSVSTHGSESSEELTISVSVTPSPDSQSDTGVNNNRSDPKPVFEGGDASPVSTGGNLSICEPLSVIDMLPDDCQDSGRKKTRNVRRSESLCVERRHSRRSGSTRAKQSRSRSDVDLQSTSTSHPLSPSPQHSVSAEGGLLPDGLVAGPAFGPFPQQEEMEPRLLELEQDPPNWRSLASPEELKKLSKKETKRQEVINELFTTEHAHVRMLSVLQTVFSRPLEREEIMSMTELATIFPSLDEIIEMHYAFYENLKKIRQENEYIVKIISTPLLNRFSGSEGEWFQKLTARFCSYQSWALEQIKSRQKKDPRFNAFILEAESKPQCRRLQLKDIIPIAMQRLTKYPLLLENIAKNTDDEAEKENIIQAAESCRKILNHVNEEVKLMENLLILKDYQRRLDTSGLKPSNDLYSEYKSIDLTTRKMLFEGPLTWRVTKEKAIDVHCVLLSDLLVLLQKQDDKMVLKCQSKSNIAVQEGKQMLSPIIKLESVFLRDVATDPKALYVIFTWDSGAQIYELVAQSGGEKKNWTEVIKSTVDELKKRGGNKLDRQRAGSVPSSASGPAYSPSHPPLSPTENGGDPLKSRGGRFKDSLIYEKSRETDSSLIDYLAANGFDLLSHSHAPPEKSAIGALDEVMYLKRLLVGSISLSDDSQTLGENGGTAPEIQEADGVEESSTEGRTEGEESGGDGGNKEEARGISAPLVLSQERLEEVQRRLQTLEEQLKRLQAVEEDHYKLQEALAKYSLQEGHYN
ncbi:rho guanine nucleotide exchange factor 1b isoform X3 [Onychostoma macrolepis]|uniref:rho guanine nucleotide exchange factor 1b isoform X3 n=1 Tax=Onychostoma macrolepis TaxID=369639 RepID=UPI00272C8EBA|nr:rho guanine nucleotide exchange factor 1b isoform X3 [Onychostoma macrolepis]